MAYSREILSALLVNYRTPNLVSKCVDSIRRFDIADDIIVVDNNSQDDSLQVLHRLPNISVVESPHNGGYGAGINQGVKRSSSKYVLVLNPDTYFTDKSIVDAITLLDADPSIGVVGLSLLNPDGSPQYSGRRFYSLLDILLRRTPLGNYFSSRVNEHLMVKEAHGHVPFESDWVMGTGMIIRRSCFDSVGGMDETYFLYLEDVDLCARVWRAGYRVMCTPSATLVHDHQRASGQGILSRAARTHLRSLRKFRQRFPLPVLTRPDRTTLRRK